MPPTSPSRKRRRSLLAWGFIVVSAGAAFVLGIVGFAEYHATHTDGSLPFGDPRIKATGLQIANARRTTSDGRDDLELIVRRLHSGALLIATNFRTELK